MNITCRVRDFVESECRKPSSKYGYEPFSCHFIQVVNRARELAKKSGADMEVVELAAWLHDIGSIVYGRENHHITGCEIAEQKLTEFGYDRNKINEVKHCILAHRGSRDIPRESLEAQIVADADAMSNFDNIAGPFMAAFLYEHLGQIDARDSIREKLENNYKKISPEAKKIIQTKYDAAMLLLK